VTICARGGRFVTPRVQGIAATKVLTFDRALLAAFPEHAPDARG
jgi:hypothetical protein